MFESQGEYATLSERVRAVRLQLFGECGGPMLARRLGIPQRRLARMEAGGPIPDRAHPEAHRGHRGESPLAAIRGGREVRASGDHAAPAAGIRVRNPTDDRPPALPGRRPDRRFAGPSRERRRVPHVPV